MQRWYIGLQKKAEKVLDKIGMKGLGKGSGMPSDPFDAV